MFRVWGCLRIRAIYGCLGFSVCGCLGLCRGMIRVYRVSIPDFCCAVSHVPQDEILSLNLT